MRDLYSGIRVHNTKRELIDQLYKEKELPIWDNRYNWYENLYVVVKDESGSQSSALTKVRKGKLILLRTDKNTRVGGISPRSKEQCFALDALMDPEVKVVTLTGKAGTGKSLISLAAALQLVDNGTYDKIMISKNTESVGKNIGHLPGDMLEKFMPHNQGMLCNAEYLLGGDKNKVQDLVEQYRIEFLPLAFIRGSSWHNSLILCDEAQNMTPHELLTLGTRISEGSKLVLMGDLNQIDLNIKKGRSGLFKFINAPKAQWSKVAASINLIKCERGDVANLFAEVLEEPDGA